jgi:hypothetical protein
VNCGPSHIQCNYSRAYSGLNIQMKVSGLLLEISGQLNALYTAKFVPNTARIIQFTLCELWSQTYTMYSQLRIFSLQHSTKRICNAIGDISTIQCMLYYKLGAKYSAHPPVFAMWTVIPDICNVITAPHIQASIFNWTYLRCNCRYHINSMRVLPQSGCHI